MSKRRFAQIYTEEGGIFGTDYIIIVDSQTGVNYLMIKNTFGTSITPLLNENGKPIIKI